MRRVKNHDNILVKIMNNQLSQRQYERIEDISKSSFENDSTFSLSGRERKYSRQFFAMYQHRLNELKKRVDKEALAKWGDNTRRVDGQVIQRKQKILDIVSGEICWVSGTVFSEMKYKLNILADVERGVDDVMPAAPQSYIGEDQSVMMLEDESGRAILHNEELLTRLGLVTGCVVGILGIEIQAGIFEVMEVICPTLSPQKPLSPPSGDEQVPQYVAFVSGLHFTGRAQCDLRAVMLQQWLSGELGCDEDAELARRVCRLVIAGNSVGELEEESETGNSGSGPEMFGSKNTSRFKTETLELFGQWLRETVSSVAVTIMPGPEDPAEVCVPQHPMHKSLFGVNSSLVGTTAEWPIHAATNPTWMQFGQCRVVGTSGQNILDIHKYYNGETKATDTMKRTLQWQHIAPTAPDTLYCYPYEEEDPFMLMETPHVYFAGNQKQFGVERFLQDDIETTVLSIPRFESTGELVLLDIYSREAKVVRIF